MIINAYDASGTCHSFSFPDVATAYRWADEHGECWSRLEYVGGR